MRLQYLFLGLSCLFAPAAAAAVVQRAPGGSYNKIVAEYITEYIGHLRLGRFVVPIQLNGKEFKVALDTGSSDLWLVTPPDFQYDTRGSIPASLGFIGSSVNGTTGFAEMSLGGYTFPRQLFLDANPNEVGLKFIVDSGQHLDGLLGLSFNFLNASALMAQFNASGLDPLAAQPFLFNIFNQKPDEVNFLGVEISRTEDLEETSQGSFTINEIDPAFADAIHNAHEVPVYPPEALVWSVLVDAIDVGGVKIPLKSSVPGTGVGMVTALDTGTPTASIPRESWYALYSNIPGALYSFNATTGNELFVIPCATTTIVTVYIGGVGYPIHPLDISQIFELTGDDGVNVTVCTNLIDPLAPGTSFVDALFGAALMTNFYTLCVSVLVKSPTGGESSIALLSLTDAHQAAAEVQSVRMAQMAARNLPAEISGPIDGFSPAVPGSTPPELPDVGDAAAPVTTPPATTPTAVVQAALGAADQDDASTNSAVNKYAPVVIGLLGANLFVCVVLAVIGLGLCVKKGGRARQTTRYQPVNFPRKMEQEPLDISERFTSDRRYND
ncbi:Peptidase A1 domain-containing protein [Mycena kentingensis (nom. inval.)]|nr:Peptidase A1 domain-containing protein [Mycena kentingensis (nom. inval.)]